MCICKEFEIKYENDGMEFGFIIFVGAENFRLDGEVCKLNLHGEMDYPSHPTSIMVMKNKTYIFKNGRYRIDKLDEIDEMTCNICNKILFTVNNILDMDSLIKFESVVIYLKKLGFKLIGHGTRAIL